MSKPGAVGRYWLTAASLKLGSVSPRLYRSLGNSLGQWRRARRGLPSSYPERAREFLAWCERHALVRDGDTVLELGTGWVHFEAIVLRLLYDVRAVLFDVWDNRQLTPLRAYTAELAAVLERDLHLPEARHRRLVETAEAVASASSFDELYERLGFRYVVDPGGLTRRIESGSIDLVFSNNVMEHVHASVLRELVRDTHRVLRPGGASWHNIDLSDHLVSFGKIRGVSRKHYVGYDDRTWSTWLENRVQYINRVQAPAWRAAFADAGFETIEEAVTLCGETPPAAEPFRGLSRRDLRCERLILACRKPSRGAC